MTRIKIAFQWLFDRLKKIRGEGFNALLTILILAGQTYILLKQTSYTREQATASRNDDRQKIYEQLSKLGPISEKALAYGYVFHEISLKRICEGACSKELVTKASLALDKEKISDLTPENYQDRSISYRSTDVAAQQLFFLYNLFKVVMPRQYDPYVSPLPEPLSDLKLLLKESELRCNTDPDDLRSFSQTIPDLSVWLTRVPIGFPDSLRIVMIESISRYIETVSRRNNMGQYFGLPKIQSAPDVNDLTVDEFYNSVARKADLLWPILLRISEKCNAQYALDTKEYRRLTEKLD